MGRKKHTKQFKKEVIDLVGNEYEFLGEYINDKTKIEARHNKCGSKYLISPNSFLAGHRCWKCRGTAPKNTKQFKKEVVDLVGNEYMVLGEYTNNRTKIKIRHNKCGFEWNITPHSFLDGSRCPKCQINSAKDTFKFKKEVFKLTGEEYIVLGEYINNRTKIKMKHCSCGHIYFATPDKFLFGQRCPKCFGTPLKTTERFKEEVIDLVGNEYEVKGEYVNALTKIEVKHNICNFSWNVKPNHFLTGIRCPFCNTKKGEDKILKYLSNNKIEFRHQYRIKECKLKRALPFDFAIFNNEKLLLIIEFDGIQHFESVEYFGGQEALKLTKKKDKIKNDYCRTNNIPILRITYKDFDKIEEILKNKIKNRDFIVA
ncbi:hypothetical protein ACFLQQ_03820 [Actinomycetota bacterium]